MQTYFYEIILFLLVLASAITIHEFSHAWVAYLLGDPTAKQKGRVSFNPIRHLDPVGTLMILIAKIGWGKPVPVNPHNFKNPIRDNAIVSFAGPFSNLLTAIIAAIPYKFLLQNNAPRFFTDFLGYFIMISVVLFLFNLLPFKPLDGAGILAYFIPRNKLYAFEMFMQRHMGHFMAFIVIDLFLLQPYGLSILNFLLFKPAQYIIQFIMIGV